MLNTVLDFVVRCTELEDVSDAYYVFEGECSDALRGLILNFADHRSSEPFRSAMLNLGFANY